MQKLLLTLAAGLLVCVAGAQTKLFQQIQERVEMQATFEKVDFFTVSKQKTSVNPTLRTILQDGALLDLSIDKVANVVKNKSENVELSLPIGDNKSLELHLFKANLYAPGARVRTSIPGFEGLFKNNGVHYRGIIKGDENSSVAISIFEDEIFGLIVNDEGNYVLGKLEKDKTNQHVVYKDSKLPAKPNLYCATPDDNYVYKQEEITENAVFTRALSDCIGLYIEVNTEIYTDKGAGTQAYIEAIFNQSAILYSNENLNFSISDMLIWVSPSPYTATETSALLGQFQANVGDFYGDLATLLGYNGGGGIAAGFSGVCNSDRDESMCYSGIQSTYANVPTYSWSVMVFTHEIGHILGSRHTHACVWNGNGTAIDGCSGQTEGGCPLPPSPPEGGTIMSYCHFTTGINFNLGFGPQPGAVIRNNLSNGSCLGTTCAPLTCTKVRFELKLDNNPKSTSWEIRNAQNERIASGGPYANSDKGRLITSFFCLDDGCYTFTIKDEGPRSGDGICCSAGNGYYRIVNQTDNSEYITGGQFGTIETKQFCLGDIPPTCNDGIQNGGETGVDCGGPDCPACPTCSDGIQNGEETGVDCGGPDCPSCGGTCDNGIQDGDETGVDCGGSDCPACPTCTDGIQNGDETGVDCGGPDCPACPTCTDGIQNGEETGVDCGGPDCPPCAIECEAPNGVRALSIRTSAALVTWNRVSEAQSYTVRWKAIDASNWQEASTSSNSYSIKNLTKGKTYEWEVRSNCAGGNTSDWSVTCTFTAGNPTSSACGSSSLLNFEQPVTVFPNPASDVLNIGLNLEFEGKAEVKMLDLLGRVAKRHTIQYGKGMEKIYVGELARGVYYVVVNGKNSNHTVKVVLD